MDVFPIFKLPYKYQLENSCRINEIFSFICENFIWEGGKRGKVTISKILFGKCLFNSFCGKLMGLMKFWGVFLYYVIWLNIFSSCFHFDHFLTLFNNHPSLFFVSHFLSVFLIFSLCLLLLFSPVFPLNFFPLSFTLSSLLFSHSVFHSHSYVSLTHIR